MYKVTAFTSYLFAFIECIKLLREVQSLLKFISLKIYFVVNLLIFLSIMQMPKSM